MKIRTGTAMRLGTLVRAGATSMAGILIIGLLSACPSPATCPSDLQLYEGKCVTHTMIAYVGCLHAKPYNLFQEIDVGATLPQAANTSVTAAYKRSRQEDSAAALQIVKDCLKLAEEGASQQEVAAVQQSEQKADRLIVVVKKRLPAIELEPSGRLDCGATDVGGSVACPGVTIKSTGAAALNLREIEMTGPDRGDFAAGQECVGMSLEPDQSCKLVVKFSPSIGGRRTATLVVHQNLPPPDHGTPLQLVGNGNGQGSTTHKLTVSVDPAATGVTVVSAPGGINCPDTTCAASFDDGADITLSANPGVSWEGCDPPDGAECHIRMSDDRAVTAHPASA
jgi:hypothetical protein